MVDISQLPAECTVDVRWHCDCDCDSIAMGTIASEFLSRKAYTKKARYSAIFCCERGTLALSGVIRANRKLE